MNLNISTRSTASPLSGLVRLCCLALFLCTLGACGASQGETGRVDSGIGNRSPGDSLAGNTETPGAAAGAAETTVLVLGDALWKTDGTAAGTQRVPYGNSASLSMPYGVTELDGQFYFQANDGVHGFELWKTDGTSAGTALVKDINPSSGVGTFHYRFTDFTAFNGELYFHANDGVTGFELWKTDGTADGTVLVKDINMASGAGSLPTDFTVFNGALYFHAGEAGRQLWKTDGTAAGTVPVSDIDVATGTRFLPDEFARGFLVFGGALHVRTRGANGYELWKSDGTTGGTALAENAARWGSYLADGFAVLNGEIYFQADYYAQANAELWKTDGADAGTVLVKDINAENGGRRADYTYTEFTVFNGELYFQARDNVNGFRLWKTDGTGAGTTLVRNGPAQATGPNNSGYTVSNGVLYFRDGTGNALWKTDGTPAGTVLVKDAGLGPA